MFKKKGEKTLVSTGRGGLSREIDALVEISRAIASGLYLEDVLRLIVTVTANVMDSKICSLWILDEKEGRLKLKATQSMSEAYLKERSLALGEGVVGNVALHNRPMAILNVLESPLFKEKELARRERLVSMLSVPMCIEQRVIGVINCYTSYPHPFSKTESEILAAVAQQAAICIENAGLMETLDMDEILRLVLEGATKNIGFDRARLYLVDEKRNILECKMAVGMDAEEVKGITLPLNREDSLIARSIFERKPFVTTDAKRDPRVNPGLRERLRLHSLVVIPLLAKQKALGAIAADFAEAGKTITSEALDSMMVLAQEAGLAIHHAFLYQELKALSRRMEERIQKMTRDLREAETQLIRSEKLAALGQLAAGIAHEIRNPLTSINILIHSLRENLPAGVPHREDLMVIEEEINRINSTVDQFLRFARPSPPLFERAQFLPLVEDTLSLLRPQMAKQSIRVRSEFDSLPPLLMDREQMKQVILNLCLNAIQAMADGGTLVLRGQRNSDGRWVLFTVEDSGPGVSSDHIHKLFDPFFSTKEGGIGLGLSIAHRIIDAHRGKIEVESLPQGGARFTVWLPVAEDHESLGGPESMSVLLR